MLTEVLAHAAQVERDSFDLELSASFVVVELGLVESDQLQNDHAYRKHFRLELVVFWFVVHLVQCLQLFGAQHILVNAGEVAQGPIVTRVPVLLVNLKQVQFDVALGTEVDGRSAVVPVDDAVLHEMTGPLEQAPHDVDQFALGETAVHDLFPLHCPLKCEVVVVAESVQPLVLDA